MKILFISSFLLFDETRFGGSKRLYSFAKALNEKHVLSIIMFDGCLEFDAFKTKKSGFSDSLVFIEKEKRNRFNRYRYLEWDMSLHLRKNKDLLDNFISNNSYDAVFVAYPLALSMVNLLPKTLLKNSCYLEDDLYFPGQLDLLNKIRNPLLKTIQFIRLLQTSSLYNKNLKNIKKVLFISEQEKEIGKKYFPRQKPYIVSYGIYVNDFAYSSSKKQTPVIGFIGNYSHVPNRDAIEHFLKKLFPTISKNIPELKVVIAGKNMPDHWLLPNTSSNRITYLKEVNDLNDFYRDLDIFINPIVSGRGMRTKLIEAAACGVPIVSTKLGAEGLEDLKIELAETDEDFTEKIKSLYLNKELYSNTAKFNRTLVEKNYSIDVVGKKLESILLE